MSGVSNGRWMFDGNASKLKPALMALLEAFDYAEDTGSELWEFAVLLRRFKELGLNESDLRWLERKGYVEHAREVTRPEDEARQFQHSANLCFHKRTCFVLTAAGAESARLFGNRNGTSVTGAADTKCDVESRETTSTHLTNATPVWDAERRELRVDDEVVKRFKWSAANQETILAAFEEEQWPPRIDDPLPPHAEQDSKRRLSDTIKCLNRKQQHPLIHFRGDGTGEGVVWERVEPDDGT